MATVEGLQCLSWAADGAAWEVAFVFGNKRKPITMTGVRALNDEEEIFAMLCIRKEPHELRQGAGGTLWRNA